jgi:hypothetical protein
VTGRRRRAEVERLRSEIEESRPYLGLAREIHGEVERAVADPTNDLDELADAIDQWPRDARLAAVSAAFRELPSREQWEILIGLYDDDELRDALAVEHRRAVAEARRTLDRAGLVDAVRENRALDTRAVARGDDLTLGLFREADTRPALVRGAASTSVARRLVLRGTEEPGRLLVIADVFNPERALFVTPDYDEAIWRAERLVPHAVVAVGSAGDDAPFEPVVFPGARLDVEVAGETRRGRLHVGYATVGDVELFTPATEPGPARLPQPEGAG